MIKLQAAQRLRLMAERSTGIGAGALFYAKDTGRMLLVKRSETCDDPNTWCCLGGGVEHGESIEQGLRREVLEEGGYDQPYPIKLIHTTESPGFTYHNHLALVESEFEPVLNHEHTDYKWCAKGDFPTPLHPKFEEALVAAGIEFYQMPEFDNPNG